MDRTAELRWFFRRPPPQPMMDWFEKAADPPESRTDCYLVLAGADALGIKVRGGTTNLEFKLRPRPPERLGLPGGITGEIEEWQRWSLPRAAITRRFPRLGLPKGTWMEVAKQRRQTTIPYRGDSGCKVELTGVRVGAQDWWTVGLESYGPETDLVAALEAAADELFGSLDLPGTLGADQSSGYPGWLSTLQA
jgi:hypothetical protein